MWKHNYDIITKEKVHKRNHEACFMHLINNYEIVNFKLRIFNLFIKILTQYFFEVGDR